MSEFSLDEFAADFLEEADQHLQIITDALLQLEREGVESREVVDGLFRSFHTLKGLCGMVGLEPAASVSHHAETLLARVRRHEANLRGDSATVLLSAARVIQDAVETIRTPGRPMPAVDQVLRALGAESAVPTVPDLAQRLAASLRPDDRSELLDRVAKGNHLSLWTFTPTPATAARHVNVNSVREQLTARGHVVKALPVTEGTSVRFAFLLASPEPLGPGSVDEAEWHPVSEEALGLTPEVEPVAAIISRNVSSVRVDVPRLDEVMRLVGDLVTSRYRLEAYAQTRHDDQLEQLTGRMARQVRDLREAVTRLRLVPLSEVFGRMPLAVRDVARSLDLQARLEVEGETTQVDKVLVERLLDPLLHLVRNALTHGLEPAAVRTAAGKPAAGTVRLSAARSGDSLTIRVEDDGRGIDTEGIVRRARQLGWWEDAREPTIPEVLDFLVRPGFSTRAGADLGAGRGVGLDVVYKGVRSLGGTLVLESEPNRYTAFVIRLPLSLAIVDALLVQVGPEVYAVPRSEVHTAIEIESRAIAAVEGAELIPFRQGALPLFQLSTLFGVSQTRPALFYGLVSGDGAQLTALGVDKLLGLQEVVVRTITDPLIARPGIAGATELGSGTVALILSLPDVIRHAQSERSRR